MTSLQRHATAIVRIRMAAMLAARIVAANTSLPLWLLDLAKVVLSTKVGMTVVSSALLTSVFGCLVTVVFRVRELSVDGGEVVVLGEGVVAEEVGRKQRGVNHVKPCVNL